MRQGVPLSSTSLSFSFLLPSLFLPLPASASRPFLLRSPRRALTTREDGGARQQLLGDVVHVWCVRHTDECTLALHTTGESPIGGMLAQLLVILATAVT